MSVTKDAGTNRAENFEEVRSLDRFVDILRKSDLSGEVNIRLDRTTMNEIYRKLFSEELAGERMVMEIRRNQLRGEPY